MRKVDFKKLIIGLLACFVFIITLLQFPELFIKHRFDYKQFSIYSADELRFDYSVRLVLDSVLTNIEQSDFHDPEIKFKLYFVHQSNYEKVLRLFGRKNMAFSYFSRHIYAAYPDFERSVLYRNEGKYGRLNLVQIITHEAVHSQMYPSYAKFLVMTGPSWVHEGYCEYISFIPQRAKEEYSLVSDFEQYQKEDGFWTKTRFGTYTPRAYLRDRILVEYLIEQRKMRVSDIMDNDSLEVDILISEIRKEFKYNN